MRAFKILIFFLLGFNLSSCGTVSNQKNFSNPDAYQLWNLENKDLYRKSYIFFTKLPFGGFYLGCNRFNFHWNVDYDRKTIGFDNIMSTRMACEENFKEQENVEKLMRVNRYKVQKNKMQLFEDDDLLFDLVLHSNSDSFFNINKKNKKEKSQVEKIKSQNTKDEQNQKEKPVKSQEE